VLGAALSAASSAAVLAVVNFAASDLAAKRVHRVNAWAVLAFVVSLILYGLAESRTVARLGADMEQAIDGLRMRLLAQLRHADLLQLEHFGETRLFESITQSCQTVSMNSQFLALLLRSVLLIVAVMTYILFLSPLACAVILGTVATGAVLYYWMGIELEARRRMASEQESALFESLSDLFDGFKEQRLNSARSDGLNDWFGGVSASMTAARNETHLRGWQQYVFGETGYTLMLGVVVFVVPVYSSSFGADVIKVTAACLFMAASVFGLMQSTAILAAAESAAERMMALEKDLATLVEPGSREQGLSLPGEFSEIRLEHVEFAFPATNGDQPFAVGPIELTVRRGETVFITGGNGSGKSTFLKLLTGLYHPSSGAVVVNGVQIDSRHLAAHRESISTVFTDFHLFQRFYGLHMPVHDEARKLLEWMELARVTSVDGDHFTRRELSAGQRKRLALVAALLEHKPVLVLDEWAADQDPQFRAKFYREVLPELKRRGLTVIAVTHDDHYFDAADRRFHMEEGRLTELPVEVGG
jgi:putative ATP-binding cassette transporter